MKTTEARRPKVVVGIDPDVDGNGVGLIHLQTKEVTKHQMKMPELVAFLNSLEDPLVIIEAGWMNHGNYHLRNKGQWHAAKIGEQVGRNHEVSRLIGEFCEFHGIPYRFVMPLKKKWKGRDGKITHDELMGMIDGSGLHMAKCRTNQEMRDAIWLAMVHSDIPLRKNL